MIVFAPQPKLKDWQRSQIMREVCLSRDGPCCVYCGCDLLADAKVFATMALDHFIPKRLGGRDGVENRVLACYACDRLKGGREFGSLEDARKWLADAYQRAEVERVKMTD